MGVIDKSVTCHQHCMLPRMYVASYLFFIYWNCALSVERGEVFHSSLATCEARSDLDQESESESDSESGDGSSDSDCSGRMDSDCEGRFNKWMERGDDDGESESESE
jgi:hypothetical protein